MKRLSSLDISDTLLGAARYNKIANFSPNIINKGNNKITEQKNMCRFLFIRIWKANFTHVSCW
jgi:hypothetical protein